MTYHVTPLAGRPHVAFWVWLASPGTELSWAPCHRFSWRTAKPSWSRRGQSPASITGVSGMVDGPLWLKRKVAKAHGLPTRRADHFWLNTGNLQTASGRLALIQLRARTNVIACSQSIVLGAARSEPVQPWLKDTVPARPRPCRVHSRTCTRARQHMRMSTPARPRLHIHSFASTCARPCARPCTRVHTFMPRPHANFHARTLTDCPCKAIVEECPPRVQFF